jgi:hypothetical protein
MNAQDVVIRRGSGPDRAGYYQHYTWSNRPETDNLVRVGETSCRTPRGESRCRCGIYRLYWPEE